MKKFLIFSLFMLTIITGFDSCKKEPKKEDDVVTDPNAALKKSIIENYADIAYYTYLDSYNKAVDLKTAIDAFTSDPTNTTKFAGAKAAWLISRESYGQTEAFRFANGPIDDANGPEGLLNSWPLDEAYIDYVSGDANAGIINNNVLYPTISENMLDSLNTVGGETNISVGYHAIEFLLWGQDLTAPSAKIPGQRPNTDFVDGGTASNQSRRRQYLSICADLLVDHLEYVKNAWDPAVSNNYRTTFLALSANDAIKNMMTGIGALSKSELAGQRIFTAYDNQDQEDEHSCFSDNTHRDIRLNAEGIRNIYTGNYTRADGISVVSGESLHDLLKVINP
ncbi:MAG: hypothetical protein NT150_14555, partial [Bacteroidetes bacterium]|nr:hypothetical protein [Bacteroidota bacterium]